MIQKQTFWVTSMQSIGLRCDLLLQTDWRSLSVSVCRSHCMVCPAKTDGLIEMPFGTWSPGGSGNHALDRGGGVENASTGKRKYGKGNYETAHFARMENACTENASTENASTMQTCSQIKKSLILHKLVWCIFKWGGKVDYRLFFLR